MARLLIIAVVITLLLLGMRRAFAAGRPARRPRARKADGGQLGPPEQLVCGACGAEFDADKHGWVCPHCGK